jgi:hypothetical protein
LLYHKKNQMIKFCLRFRIGLKSRVVYRLLKSTMENWLPYLIFDFSLYLKHVNIIIFKYKIFLKQS